MMERVELIAVTTSGQDLHFGVKFFSMYDAGLGINCGDVFDELSERHPNQEIAYIKLVPEKPFRT